jgi:hypothetical protein
MKRYITGPMSFDIDEQKLYFEDHSTDVVKEPASIIPVEAPEPALPSVITTVVDGFLGLEKGSLFILNEELGRYEHNWSNENVTRNVSFTASLYERNYKFFQEI